MTIGSKANGTANGTAKRGIFHSFSVPKLFGGGRVHTSEAAIVPTIIETTEDGPPLSPTKPSFQTFISGKKPTISELIRYQQEYEKTDAEITFQQRNNSSTSSDLERGAKNEGFGWITGVLIRCVLCIFGATLFLRMSWIAGQGGILLGIGVVLLSLLVVIITAISMSAIATNGEVKNGGCYYLISRSLGPEFGGSIGLILYIANTVNASMNCVGLAEALVDILEGYGFKLLDGAKNDVRIYGVATCLILQAIIFIGTEFESKTQLLLLVTIIMSLLSHFVGTLLPISEFQLNQGVVGYSWTVLWDNMWPDFRNGETFITMFGVYFPAMTGIMAGANMSGDLKDPSKSIPKGTVWAIIVTTITYLWCMVITASGTVRDATGDSPPVFDNVTHQYIPPPCRLESSCKFGLANEYEIMSVQGAWSPLIVAGIVATTLSSASGCLIGAPRIFQALCADKLFPFIHPFAKGHGSNNDPFRAYFLTFFIAAGVTCIGELNAIANLITNFFLAAFAITNFACFDASAAKSPGFRPGFRYYNKWMSLFGAVLCVVAMFVLSWATSLVTFLVLGVMFLFIKHNKAHVNWGTSADANRYRKALNSLLKITRSVEHVKNYRPQLLVLTGNPAARQSLVDFAYCITKGQNLMLCGHVIPYNSSVSATACIRKLNDRFTDWLHEERIKSFYCGVAHSSLRGGVQCLLQTVGLGKMQPNILLLGYRMSWIEQCVEKLDDYKEYVGVISDAFESNMSICVFRNENEGLDHSALLSPEERLFLKLPDYLLSNKESALNDDLSRGVAPKVVRPRAPRRGSFGHSKSESNLANVLLSSRLNTEVLSGGRSPDVKRQPRVTKFRHKHKDGLIDVWWLFDDGGLTLLLSYLLESQPSFLQGAKLRVFTVCSKKVDAQEIHENLVSMLKKFRIHFHEVRVLHDDDSELYPETMEEHNEMMERLNRPDQEPAIPDELLESTRERTNKYLRHRELLLQFSASSSLVITTLPVAAENVIMSPVYMMWLELLSGDMPPMLFVRGNQTSVLTYYS